GKGAIGQTDRINDRELLAVPGRLQGTQRRVESEASVDIDRAVWLARFRYHDRGPQVVVPFFREGDDDVQAVGRAALKDSDEDLFSLAVPLGSGPDQPRRGEAHAGERHRGCTDEEAAREHDYLR